MGIATSTGVIRDFAGPYHVSEDNMTFGKPTKYWQLNYAKAKGGTQGWDAAVAEASEIYKTRMVSLLLRPVQALRPSSAIPLSMQPSSRD